MRSASCGVCASSVNTKSVTNLFRGFDDCVEASPSKEVRSLLVLQMLFSASPSERAVKHTMNTLT